MESFWKLLNKDLSGSMLVQGWVIEKRKGASGHVFPILCEREVPEDPFSGMILCQSEDIAKELILLLKGLDPDATSKEMSVNQQTFLYTPEQGTAMPMSSLPLCSNKEGRLPVYVMVTEGVLETVRREVERGRNPVKWSS